MLIDKKDIEKAKEKLGDKNAFLIADLLELDNFDEKNLKACCPYHNEDTASFIYNKRNYTFHCFGCNKTVDIIDVLMEKGNTFLEAAKYLFDKANVEYSFGEKDVKTRRNYRYPHEEPLNGKTNVLEYWGKRGISKNVIDYLDIREDLHGNGVFNFYDTNDVLTMVKYRPARTIEKHSGQPKTWCQKDSDTSALLFNMNRVNTSKPLLITEGETDCASAIEAGYINTVSVPLGAGNLHWIEENWDWLNNFDSIIIWSDNDEAGIKMRKECIYRLGTWRTKYITAPEYFEKENGKKVPIKDINDCLQIGGKNFVMNLISDAKDVPVKSVVDYSEIEELDISQMDGVKTGIKPLDEELLKIFYGTLTVLSGRPGSGKTSIIDQTIARTIDNGNPVFLFSKEMPERMSANWFNTIIAGRRNMVEKTSRDNRKYYIVPQSIQKKMQTYYNKKLFIYELNAIIDTKMADYFLIDYELVKTGVENGGIITKTGRGSGVSYYVNSLLGFSNIDRFISPVKLYPDRFISKTRILKTKSLPDLDLNLGTPEIFADAQIKVMGESIMTYLGSFLVVLIHGRNRPLFSLVITFFFLKWF